MKLYELTTEFNELFNALEQSEDGNVSPEIAERLSKLEGDIANKIDGCCRVMKTLDAEAKAFAAEADRLLKAKRQRERHADWLKTYVREQMEVLGEDKLKTELFSLSICNNSNPSVSIFDEDMVPVAYNLPVERRIDKSAILADVEGGKDVPGVEVVCGKHLRIR